MKEYTFIEEIIDKIFEVFFYLLFTIPGICATIVIVPLIMSFAGACPDLIIRVERVVVPVLLATVSIGAVLDGRDNSKSPSNHGVRRVNFVLGYFNFT